MIAYSDRNVPDVFPRIDVALNNRTHYIKTQYKLRGKLFDPDIGFKPQIVDPLPVLKLLKKQGVISSIDTKEMTDSAFNESLILKNNTAKILRLIVQTATYQDFQACGDLWDNYREQYELDVAMVNYALECSSLIQKALGMTKFKH